MTVVIKSKLLLKCRLFVGVCGVDAQAKRNAVRKLFAINFGDYVNDETLAFRDMTMSFQTFFLSFSSNHP